MAEWDKNKVLPSEINGGKEFTTNDNLAVTELNAIVNNSFYGVDFVEAIADEPDISEINGDGNPSVSFVNNPKDGKTFKKFKFSNLKGEKGDRGNGITNIEQGVSVGNYVGYRIHFDDGSYFDYEVKNGRGIKYIEKSPSSRFLIDTYIITFDDLDTYSFSVTNGRGIDNITKTSTNGLVDTYTINYNDLTTETFKVVNGEKGDKGEVGATFTYDEITKTLTITTP